MMVQMPTSEAVPLLEFQFMALVRFVTVQLISLQIKVISSYLVEEDSEELVVESDLSLAYLVALFIKVIID